MRSRSVAHDEELLAELAADPDAGLARLVLAYQDRLFSFALRLLGSPRDAEEAVQDAFVRAYRALRRYPAERTLALALKPWLYRIALNLCRNRLRARHPMPVSLDREREAEPEGRWDLPEDERQRPEALLERDEERRSLAELLASLPERYRVAVVLRFVEGLSYGEAAQILKQPAGTVKSNVHRGIRVLRTGMAERERARTRAVEVHR